MIEATAQFVTMIPERTVSILWVLWYLSWIVAAWWSERVIKRPGLRYEVAYRLFIGTGVMLLFGYYPYLRGSDAVLWRLPSLAAWSLLAPVTLGFIVTWWARIHLGRLWSSSVTRKSEHRVIETGPYRLVRHPIYWGLTLAAVSTAVIRGRLSAILGALALAFGFYVKARLEERFLREELGPEYELYTRRVGLLLPSVRR
jgi:protein-S-isoprenylcysteine O-methyltransferase Ste14